MVDDDEDDHFIFTSICEKLGLPNKLMILNNGFDVLKYLKTTEQKTFAIICDINMPNLDGLSLRSLINEDAYLRSKSIPFIFFSTSATVDQVRTAYDLTVQGFFIKGNSFEETEQKFRRIVEYWSDCKHPNSVK